MEHISTILERIYKEIVIVYNENRNERIKNNHTGSNPIEKEQ